MGRVDITGSQIGAEQLFAAEDVERQETPVAVVAVEMASRLVAMHAVWRSARCSKRQSVGLLASSLSQSTALCQSKSLRRVSWSLSSS